MAIVLPKPRRGERDYSEDVIGVPFVQYLQMENQKPNSNISTRDIVDTIQVYLSGGSYTNLPEKLQQQYKSYDLGRPIEKQKKESPKFTMDTPQYGELTITGVGEFNPKLNRLSLETDKGNFHFYTQDVLDKGYIVTEGAGGQKIDPKQVYYDLLINDDLRTEYDEKSFQVDLSSIPSTFNERNKLGISGSRGDFSDFETKQGVLIPEELHNKVSAESYTITDEKGAITGLANTTNNPYIKENFVYAREGNEKAPKGNIDLRYINADNEFAYSYSWEDDGFFNNLTGINILDNTLDSISDAFASVEDIGREGIDQIDAALENPYVQGVVKTIAAVSPDPVTKAIAAGIDAYTTVDSGEDLSAGQIVNLVTSTAGAIQASGGAGGTMSAEGGPPQTGGATETSTFDSVIQAATDETVQKIAGAGASIIDGEDPIDVIVDVFSDEIIEGVADTADTAIGKEAGDAIRDNTDITNTVIDVAQGDDVSTAIANNLGDRAAEAIGADTTNEIALVKAGLTTGAGLDQGLDTDEALLEGAKTYYEEGGTVDLDIDPNLTGDLDLAFGDINIDLPDIGLEDAIVAFPAVDLPEVDIDIPEVELPEVDVEIPEVELPEVDVPEVDIEIPEVDVPEVDIDIPEVDVEIPEVDTPEVDIEIPEVDVPEVEVELPEVDVPEVDIEIPEVDIPEVDIEIPEVDVEKPDFEGPDIEEPDISKPTLDLMQFAGLLSTTGGGKAPTEEEQERSRYQTQFDFLAGLQPLGMLGNFQRRS